MSLPRASEPSLSLSGELVVVKIGGSLLELPDLRERIVRLLEVLGNVRPVLLAGGGKMVDVIRTWDETFGLGDALSHRLAVQAMSLTARLLASLCSATLAVRPVRESPFAGRKGTMGFAIATEVSQLGPIFRESQVPVFDVAPLLLAASPPPLAESWHVTSDSIAAWLAKQIGARRLVLAKSAEVTGASGNAAACGLVDRYLEIAGAGLGVEIVNLRAEALKLVGWPPAELHQRT